MTTTKNCGPVLREDGEPSDFTLDFFGVTREQAKKMLEEYREKQKEGESNE